jgi:PAS domain S-box-containing protein
MTRSLTWLRFGVFLLAFLFLAIPVLEGHDDSDLHTLADTSVCLVTCILAWLLWDLGVREESAPTRWLAIAFAVTAFWQSLHALVAVTLIAAAVPMGFPTRPVTWPIPAYLLPVGILGALVLSAPLRASLKAFAAALAVVGIAFFLVFRELAPYSAPGWQGITRPFLLGIPVLWLAVGLEAGRRRDAAPLALPLALASAILFLAHASMLFSQAPHDPMAMLAHVGMVVGLVFFMTHVIHVRDVGLRERDVAARDTSHALQNLGARLDTTLDNMDAAFFTVDHDWRFTYVNKEFERLLSRPREDLLGNGLWDEFKSAIGGPSDIYYHQAMAETRAVMFEEFYAPIGMWLEVRAYPSDAGLAVYFRDVTERKRAATELLESQARLSGIVTSAMDAIITIDSGQRIVLFNRAAERMFGWSASEMQGRSLDELIPARFRAIHASHVERFGAAGVTSRSMGALGALSGLRRDGEEFPIEASISQVEVAGQKLFTVILRDITERKRAAAELAESQERLSGIVTSAMDAIITIDNSQHIVLFNRAAERMFQCASGDILGRPLDTLIPARFRALHAGHVERFGAAGVTSRSMGALGALSGLRSNGEEFPIEASISQVEVAGQKLYTVILRDITERKRTEQALRLSEETFRFLNDLGEATRTLVAPAEILAVMARMLGEQLRASRCAYADVEEDGERFTILHDYTDGCATTVGTYQLSLFGPRAVATLHAGQTLIIRDVKAELTADEGGAMFTAIGIQAIITCPLVKQGALRAMMAVHQTKPRDWTAAEIDLVQDVVQRCWASLERRKAEERIHQLNLELEQRVVDRTAQLEAANKELEAFSYSVSHDLRAPLRTVDGFSQALLEDFGPQLPEEGQRQVRTIREGAQRMGALIDDLLAFSRLGRQSLDQAVAVDMDSLVHAALEELAPERAGRALEIRAAPLPPGQGDAALLRQVWVNLLSNALKYSRKRDPAVVEIGSLSNGGATEYFVRDNGTGFDMRYAQKLFGVFQRLHRAEEFEGTGVGLAIVQRIVQRHGGRVWADSAPGQGATFHFTLKGGEAA